MSASIVPEFEQIVSTYERTLYGYARRIMRNTQDAEEVVQDAFVRAHRALSGMSPVDREELRLRPWLHTITLNVARNALRRKRPMVVSLDAVDDPDRLLMRESSDLSPERALEQRMDRDLIEGAIRGVPEYLQATVRLRFIDGLTTAEIAHQFDQPVGTVKSHVHRAAIRMRRFLEHRLDAA